MLTGAAIMGDADRGVVPSSRMSTVLRNDITGGRASRPSACGVQRGPEQGLCDCRLAVWEEHQGNPSVGERFLWCLGETRPIPKKAARVSQWCYVHVKLRKAGERGVQVRQSVLRCDGRAQVQPEGMPELDLWGCLC